MGPVSTKAKNQEIPWRKYTSSELVLRLTSLSTQALVEIIQDTEVLLSKPSPILHTTSPIPRPTIVQRSNKAVVKCPHGSNQEEVYQISFPNEQIAQAAMGAMRPYFNINPSNTTNPVNGAGIKRPRTQSQAVQASQQPRRQGPVQHPMPQMYDFANPGNPYHPPPPMHSSQYPMHPAHYTAGLPGPMAPNPDLEHAYVHPPPSIPITRTSPVLTRPAVYPTPPITIPTPAPAPTPTPVREPSPPIEESQTTDIQADVETQPFQETQYSPPKSSSSSCEKPTNAQIQISSMPESSDETPNDNDIKPSSSGVVMGDLLSLEDDYPALDDHPAMDPYEGMPWSRAQGQGRVQSEQAVSRPNHYIDAGVYSMTEDQLDDIISEIVLETGFQGMCERIWRVMDARFLNEGAEDMYDEDAF